MRYEKTGTLTALIILITICSAANAYAAPATKDTSTTFYTANTQKAPGSACSITFYDNSDSSVSYTAYDSTGRMKSGTFKNGITASTDVELTRVMRTICPSGCLDDALTVSYTYGALTGAKHCDPDYDETYDCKTSLLEAYTHYIDTDCNTAHDTDDNGCDLYVLHNSYPAGTTYNKSCQPLDSNGCDLSALGAGNHYDASCNEINSNGCNVTCKNTHYTSSFTFDASCNIYTPNGCLMSSLAAGSYYGQSSCSTYDSHGCPSGYSYVAPSSCVSGKTIVATVAIWPYSYYACPISMGAGGLAAD